MEKVIKAKEISDHEGKLCPECHKGEIKRELDHDPVAGNSIKLKCSAKALSCGFTVDIVSD